MSNALLLIEHVPRTSKEVCALCILVGRKGSDLNLGRPDSLGKGLAAWEERYADHLHGMENRNCSYVRIERTH